MSITIPQAIFTAGSNSGYSLTATSPSFQDNGELEIKNGVTNYLQGQTNRTATYFSFFSISGNRYIFTQRFIKGMCGGANRVVVHGMIFTAEFLDTYLWDIEAIRTLGHLSFTNQTSGNAPPYPSPHWGSRGVPTSPLSLADLKNYVGGVGINTLVDLTISCDFAIKQQVQVFCKQQQDLRGGAWVQVRPPHLHLQPLWTRDTLCNLLQGAMHAISKGKTVMLPQGDVYERALLFIWNALPPRDHPNVPWSTNFYSGAGFRLANNPQSLQEQPQQNVTMLRTPPRPPMGVAPRLSRMG